MRNKGYLGEGEKKEPGTAAVGGYIYSHISSDRGPG
jgi:hypothetical protein